MKYLIRVAFTVLSVATIAPVANAATLGRSPQTSVHNGPYDNTGHGPGNWIEGGNG